MAVFGLVPAAPAPRLELQLTVDQLRGDQLARDRDKCGRGGFRFLLDRGVYHADGVKPGVFAPAGDEPAVR